MKDLYSALLSSHILSEKHIAQRRKECEEYKETMEQLQKDFERWKEGVENYERASKS